MKNAADHKMALNVLGVSDVEVTLQMGKFCLMWLTKEGCFHVWITPTTRKIERGIGMKTATLYKNPPKGIEQGQEGYFKCRRLDANKNISLIQQITNYAEAAGLFEDALATAEQTEQQRLREAAEDAALNRAKEAGPRLLAAAKEAVRFLDASADSPMQWPVSRANLYQMLTDAISAAESKAT